MAARHPVLVAVPDPWEPDLVATLESSRTLTVARRCLDLAEVLATAGAGRVVGAFVAPDLPGLDRETVARLHAQGVRVVAVLPPGLPDADPGVLAAAVTADSDVGECEQALDQASPAVSARAYADPSRSLGSDVLGPGHPLGSRVAAAAPTGQGQVVAVWGPVGAPGRTSVAVGLAEDLGYAAPALLVDADTYGPSIAQHLGLLDEAPGLAAACRAADAGVLDPAELSRRAPFAGDTLRVLTGLARADRWPELSATAMAEVLQVARRLVRWSVVDTGFCLEQDEELSYDTLAPRRNQATLTALEHADVVVAVGSADPVGLQRLLAGLDQLRQTFPECEPVVAVTRVRAAAVGREAQAQVVRTLRRYGGIGEVTCLPDDRAGYDAALLAGRTLTEWMPRSPVVDALAELAERVRAAVDGTERGVA